MAVPPAILNLTQNFEFHLPSYKRGQKKEAEIRRQFIDPFFKAMGWDVDNNQGYSEAYKEVAHEEPIKIRGTTNFIDYAFRIGGQTKFLVEAKEPKVNVKEDVDAALQLRRYAWNANLKMSILTDFEEFAVYDCTIPIGTKDNAATARIAYFTYEEYPEKWDWIESIFSQESIKLGSFDRYVESKKGKRGTARVDEAFLADIENWRDVLARNIALRNTISKEELNTVVQQTIDRIVFLRICEDRGIEKYGRLGDLTKNGDIYPQLCRIFQEADDRYNSGLFHFHEEPGRPEMPDTISLSLTIDDKVLKEIIGRLYYPESPYEFSLIPTEILGHVYEQFLGKVIRLTDGGRAKVEYKPEVRKAGGVFYTPSYIVEYIVKNTVGKLVEGKSPKEVADLHILDPACGSGSFLIGAYQFLLDWHRDWYIEHLVPVIKEKGATSKEVQALIPVQPQPKARGRGKPRKLQATDLPVYAAGNGNGSRVRSDWRLTSAERKRILLNNIYGVDIDTQAVEVTKLSLLLKVLEGENEETVSKQLTLFHERALPSLHQNIKCGNSLIGPDIFTDEKAALSPEEIRQINPFDWQREFSSIMSNGGFDAVIGNPPYVRQEVLGQEFKEYTRKRYDSYAGTADLYVYFIEKSHRLLRKSGYFGIICSNKFMRAKYGVNLRKFIVNNTNIRQIVDFGELPVFQNASTFPAIFLTKNESNPQQKFIFAPIKTLEFTSLGDTIEKCGYSLNNKSIEGDNWTLASEDEVTLIEKMRDCAVSLGDYIDNKIYRGLITGLNTAFVIDEKKKNEVIFDDCKSQELIKPFLTGKDLKRYSIPSCKKFLIFIPSGFTNSRYQTHSNKWKAFKIEYPAIASHLEQYKEEAEKRWDKGDYWWELRSCDYYNEFENPKIMLPDIAKESRMVFDDSKHYAGNTIYFIPTEDFYLFGILNSKLIFHYYKRNASVLGDADKGGRLRWFIQDVVNIPIRTIDPNNPTDVARHDRMVGLVDRMLALHREKEEVRDSHARELIERQIEATDAEIDRLVYELYGLTEEEIRIVEGR